VWIATARWPRKGVTSPPALYLLPLQVKNWIRVGLSVPGWLLRQAHFSGALEPGIAGLKGRGKSACPRVSLARSHTPSKTSNPASTLSRAGQQFFAQTGEQQAADRIEGVESSYGKDSLGIAPIRVVQCQFGT
jgi:hypothetical protein